MGERPRTLQIEEDMRFQRREWRLQRGGRVLLGLLLVAALLGVFSNGPLSHATATASVVTLDYQRFVRSGANVEMTVRVPVNVAQNQHLAVWLPNTFVDAIEIESVQPEPEGVEVRGDGLAYVFAVPRPRGVLQAVFRTRPQREGLHRARLDVNDRPAIRFWQVVYP